MSGNAAASKVASQAKPSLTLKRRYKAKPARVFAAWTRPEALMAWFGPAEVTVQSAEVDLTVGGRFRVVMQGLDGEMHRVGGVYREIVPDARLVFSWAWETTPERESLVTVTMAADGDGTLLTLYHEQFFDAAARDRHEHGWTGSLVRLESHLANVEASMNPWQHGTFYWNELMTREVEAAKAFYGAMLGWTFDAMPMPQGTYWVAKAGDRMAGGIFDMNAPEFTGIPEHWMAYIAVEDADKAFATGAESGATVMRPPFDIEGIGRIAIIKDTGGAVLGIMTPARPAGA